MQVYIFDRRALLHHVVLRMRDVFRRSLEHDKKLSSGRLEIVKRNAVMTSHLGKRNGFGQKVVVRMLIRNAPQH